MIAVFQLGSLYQCLFQFGYTPLISRLSASRGERTRTSIFSFACKACLIDALVLSEGVEPSRLSAADFKSAVSAIPPR